MHYVYIVECKDGTLYTGWTTDIKRRINEHNQGKGAKYTRSRCPVVLKYFEEFTTKQEAMKREYQLKHWSRAKKEALISNDKVLLKKL